MKMRIWTILLSLTLLLGACGDDNGGGNNGAADVGVDTGDVSRDSVQETDAEADIRRLAEEEATDRNEQQLDPNNTHLVVECIEENVGHICNHEASPGEFDEGCIWKAYNAGTADDPNWRPACTCSFTISERMAATDC